ncbi:hypothetical protein [Streptomyces sp. AV19]|uniref:hypothetical protein n=1 Tax=Streptomyces sp. AV19 TaxID=2793068 RepID=UPI001F4835FB|nr:hypothetical protein [Streptomyces sp. AV19]MDG4536496.1 hypothetical protein [Streptomyces sp. AV19]
MANILMRRSGRALLVGAAAAVALGAAALPASADSEPTTDQLMADCASGVGKCTFNDPQVGKAYLGNYHQVSNTLYNCSTSDATQGLNWSDKVGSTDSLDVSITAGGKIAGIVDLSVTAKYGHTWTTEHSDGGSMGMTVKPGEVGWISRAQVMREVDGRWQTHYDDPHWGHYYWFWDDTITSPAPNDTDGVKNTVIVKTRPMTAEEKASCGGHNGKTFLSKTKVEVPKNDKAPRKAPGKPTPGQDDKPPAREEKTDKKQ